MGKPIWNLLLIPLFLTSVISVTGTPVDEQFSRLTDEQKQILIRAYELGAPYDLGYTLAAIAWQESFVGDRIVPINLQDPSAGLWHKNIYNALAEHPETPQNGLQVNMMAQKLIHDMEFAASLAISDLEHWKIRRNGNWMDIWASYNAGRYYKSSQARAYARSIYRKIQALEKALPVLLAEQKESSTLG
ncbi:MAG: hypothetical protein D6762_09205 [Candidatus Neomarinimicrobiota bacterium]|nr:MAG: hypothetical protein D6762_09205 [Candidatus Neomarinimicrobiota bacterium]